MRHREAANEAAGDQLQAPRGGLFACVTLHHLEPGSAPFFSTHHSHHHLINDWISFTLGKADLCATSTRVGSSHWIALTSNLHCPWSFFHFYLHELTTGTSPLPSLSSHTVPTPARQSWQVFVHITAINRNHRLISNRKHLSSRIPATFRLMHGTFGRPVGRQRDRRA